MVLLMFALVVGILAYDGLQPGAGAMAIHLPWWGICLVMVVPILLLLAAEQVIIAWGLKQFPKGRGHFAFRVIDRAFRSFAWLATALYALDLVIGGLTLVRRAMGDWILLDELVFMLPTFCYIVCTWAIYYPIEKRLREAVMISRADIGLPVHTIPTRGGYVLAQIRHYGGLFLLPLLLLLLWDQIVTRLCSSAWQVAPASAATPLFVAGTALLFLFVPFVIRAVWDTVPIASGEVRDELLSLCDHCGIRVRQLLLWRTGGLQVNAAVIGVFAPMRFIMLTDALLETVPRLEIRAVMAHEIAHVRRHHMFWLVCAAAGCIGLLELCANFLLTLMPHWLNALQGNEAPGTQLIVYALLGIVWWAIFGYISRRFERQADTFAVQYFANLDQYDASARRVIEQSHVLAMAEALERTGSHHPGRLHMRNWRHGSIRWRQDYLRSLVGQPVDHLPIDRQLYWMNLGSLLAVVISVIFSIWAL